MIRIFSARSPQIQQPQHIAEAVSAVLARYGLDETAVSESPREAAEVSFSAIPGSMELALTELTLAHSLS